MPEAGVGLDTSGQDLAGGQDESVGSSVTELNGEAVGGLGDILNVVDGSTSGLVDGRASRSVLVSGTIDGADSIGDALGEGLKLGVVGSASGARVAVRSEEELRVRVDVNVEDDTLAGSKLVDVVPQAQVLGSITLGDTLVVLGARVGAGTAADGPLVGPVAVDVTAQARVTADGLPVLAPETVVGLREEETVGVDDWEEVVVVLVDEALNLVVGGVLGEEVVGEVLDSLKYVRNELDTG